MLQLQQRLSKALVEVCLSVYYVITFYFKCGHMYTHPIRMTLMQCVQIITVDWGHKAPSHIIHGPITIFGGPHNTFILFTYVCFCKLFLNTIEQVLT